MTKEYYLLVLSRFLTGFFQVFISIFWPVWTDAFAGTEKRKAAWMSTYLAASPVGVLFGYVITTQLIINYNWEYAFYLQCVAVGPAIILILMMPLKYFNLRKNATSATVLEDIGEESNMRSLDSESARPQYSVRD